MIMKAQVEEINLWMDQVPDAIFSEEYQEVNEEHIGRVRKVKNPTLKIFKPKNPNGTAVVICPGGGYSNLVMKHEGEEVATWLNTLGMTAFVLKYRLPSNAIMQRKSIAPLQDAQEAIRVIRRNAQQWNLAIDKIGIMGFSAGGHLAASLSTRFDENLYVSKDKTSAKPNFAILIYPVISMLTGITHKNSRNRLLGQSPSNELISEFSVENHVSNQTPPTFLVHAIDDEGVSVENSIRYFTALKQHQVLAEIHLYQKGGHGFGLGKETESPLWTSACEAWLQLNGWASVK